MKLLEQLNQLDRLDALISRKGTGDLNQLSSRLSVSKRTVQNLIATLRSLGAEIKFCRYRNSYIYTSPIQLQFKLVVKNNFCQKSYKMNE